MVNKNLLRKGQRLNNVVTILPAHPPKNMQANIPQVDDDCYTPMVNSL